MATTTRSIVIVAGLGAIIALASGNASSAPPAVPRSKPRRSRVRAPDPEGDVTLGPLTQIKTIPKSSDTTRVTDLSSLTPEELQRYKDALAETGDIDTDLLTKEQGEALESLSVESARAIQPGASRLQQELARRAAIKARQALGIGARAPSNPTVSMDAGVTRDDAPKAYVSPPTPIDLDKARKEAGPLARHIKSKGVNYSRQSLRAFQGHAGLTVDGIYGPLSASALSYFGAPAPKPLFKAAAGAVIKYAPAT